MRIPLKNWKPDLVGLTNDGMLQAKNVIPNGGGGYIPQKNPLVNSFGSNPPDLVFGAISTLDASGVANTFAGTAAGLYKLNGGTFSDVSKAGGYTLGTNERWEFAQYGQRVIGTQISNAVQYYDLNSSTLFADLPGSPPQARHIAIIRDFVVLGNTTNSPNEIFWSAFNNSGQWTQGLNQCDAQTLQGGGWVQAIVGGEVGFIFQEHAITRMTYVGPPLIFQFDLVEQFRGLAAPGGITTVGDTTFYYTQEGFYKFDPVNGSQPIGVNRVDNWFAANALASGLPFMTCAADPAKKIIVWNFTSNIASTIYPDTFLIYNYSSDEFSWSQNVGVTNLFPALTQGLTLEQLDSIYPHLDTMPQSLDSRAFTGGNSYLGGFSGAAGLPQALASLDNSNLVAEITTGILEPSPGRRSMVTNVRPITDSTSIQAAIYCSSRMQDLPNIPATEETTSLQANGDLPFRSSGRYHLLDMVIPAGTTWSFITFADYDAQDDGEQ